ncbi:MAG: hypothetical protein ABIJ40_20820 [Bacteroidota bacterium]
MDYRQKAFREKFESASVHLGVTPNQIVSLKFREIVHSYSEYHNLLDILQREANISHKKLNDNFQGTGYLLSDANSKVILVEHETGLELLYIAGSVASLVGLVHLIIQCWAGFRNHFNPRHRDFQCIEIRMVDNKGNVKEEHLDGHNSQGMSFLPSSLIISTIQNLENEVKSLKQEVKILSKHIKEKPTARKGTTKKNKESVKTKSTKK